MAYKMGPKSLKVWPAPVGPPHGLQHCTYQVHNNSLAATERAAPPVQTSSIRKSGAGTNGHLSAAFGVLVSWMHLSQHLLVCRQIFTISFCLARPVVKILTPRAALSQGSQSKRSCMPRHITGNPSDGTPRQRELGPAQRFENLQ